MSMYAQINGIGYNTVFKNLKIEKPTNAVMVANWDVVDEDSGKFLGTKEHVFILKNEMCISTKGDLVSGAIDLNEYNREHTLTIYTGDGETFDSTVKSFLRNYFLDSNWNF